MLSTDHRFRNSILEQQNLSSIVFVDGNSTLDYLDEIFSYDFIQEPIQFAVYISHIEHHKNIFDPHVNRHNVTFIRTKTNKKNSSQFAISIQAAYLDSLLDKSVSYYFVIPNHSAHEIALHFTSRSCYITDPKDIRTEVYDNQGITLSYDLFSKTRYHKSTAKKINKLDENDLRQYFRQNWPLSQSSFAKLFEIDKANFSKWLQCKKSSSCSAKSVRTWIESLDFGASPNRLD